jgi:flagellar hook-basal body complex protein FliE
MNLSFLTKLPFAVGSTGSNSFGTTTASGIATSTSGSSFADAIGNAIKAVESSQQSAKTATMNLLAGGQGDVHSVALVSQRAELSLELFQQVRNKFVSAYQEIMKMPM